MTTNNKPTIDDLNDLARKLVEEFHGAKPPAGCNADEADAWRERSDQLFHVACEAMGPRMTLAEAETLARAALQQANP